MSYGPELHEDLSALPGLLASHGPFLLVRDPIAWEASGAAAALGDGLTELGAVPFEEQGESPCLEEMQRAADRAGAEGCRAIVAVGGGTSIDTAKGAAWCLAGGAIDAAPAPDASLLPLFAVPTTAGTGSEATHFAVCWHDGVKHSLADPRLRPMHAIVDSSLHLSLPPRLTATTGLDALCQSLESLWARGATDASRADGTQAAQLILPALETAVTQPTPESRRQMARGAHFAGRAIDVSKTTTPHALSYALTHDHGVPHGFAVALTFGASLKLRHERKERPSGTDEVTALLGGSLEGALSRLHALLSSCSAPTRLRDVGVERSDLAALAAKVNPERLANDTLAPSEEDLREVLRSSW
ncbi:MAG: phosphonoacetaldehyde reductase [Planctomycetes bacterium]|nr:phosphonoacetaldehyde reductase [Planctomycetota bacterium]